MRASSGRSTSVFGVWGSVRAVLAAASARQVPHILMLLPEAADADTVAGDAIAFGSDELACRCPFPRVLFLRRRFATRITPSGCKYCSNCFAAIPTWMSPCWSRPTSAGRCNWCRHPKHWSRRHAGSRSAIRLNPEEIRRWLAEAGFAATSAVQLPGEFAARGGLLDIYSADQPQPHPH